MPGSGDGSREAALRAWDDLTATCGKAERFHDEATASCGALEGFDVVQSVTEVNRALCRPSCMAALSGEPAEAMLSSSGMTWQELASAVDADRGRLEAALMDAKSRLASQPRRREDLEALALDALGL